MKQYFLKLVFFSIILTLESPAKEKTENPISIGSKHMMIITADAENIWGSYYFGIFNNNKEPLYFSTTVILPEETVDFQVQQGALTKDFHLDNNGNFLLSGTFKNGMTLVNIGFKIPAKKFGENTITFKTPMEFDEVNIVVPKDIGLSLYAANFSSGVNEMMSQEKYVGLIKKNIKKDEVLQVSIQGLPQFRYYSWMISAIFGIILIIGSFFYTLKNDLPIKNV